MYVLKYEMEFTKIPYTNRFLKIKRVDNLLFSEPTEQVFAHLPRYFIRTYFFFKFVFVSSSLTLRWYKNSC